MSEKKFYDVYAKHEGYLSDKWVQYLFIYETLLSRFCQAGAPVSMLEIGVQNGGSLENWKNYLPEGSRIYGVDIDPKCAGLKFSDGITFFLGDGTDKKFIDTKLKGLHFDIIIDDGSHICQDVIDTFLHLFPRLNPGGIFIAEDLHTSYWKKVFHGGFREPNASVEFFKGLADAVNFDHIKKFSHCSREEIARLREFNKSISRVSFFDSVCAVEKFFQPKRKPFDRVSVGNVMEVVTMRDKTLCSQEQLKEKIAKNKKIFLG